MNDAEIFTMALREVERARKLFPGPNLTTLALMEEAGEVVKAVLDEDKEAVKKECIQLMAMCIRLIQEGDFSVDEWRKNKNLDPL